MHIKMCPEMPVEGRLSPIKKDCCSRV